MRKIRSIPMAALLAFASVSLIFAESAVPVSRLEREAHKHYFYSERIPATPARIDYVVCNKKDIGSDFFWPYAAFGVGSNPGLEGHRCVSKTDFLSRIVEGVEDFQNIEARVEIITESANIPTVYWCEFGSVDRCDPGLLGSIVKWTSSLREFAEGADGAAVQPVFEGSAQLEGDRYEIEIRRNDRGHLLIAAVAPSPEGLRLQSPDVESVVGVLGDAIPLPVGKLTEGLAPGMPAILVPVGEDPAAGRRIIFENQTAAPIRLAIIALVEDTPTYRIDTVPLLAPR